MMDSQFIRKGKVKIGRSRCHPIGNLPLALHERKWHEEDSYYLVLLNANR